MPSFLFSDGFIMKSIMFPGTPYLNIKLKEWVLNDCFDHTTLPVHELFMKTKCFLRFQQRGGKIIQKKVNSFDEVIEQLTRKK